MDRPEPVKATPTPATSVRDGERGQPRGRAEGEQRPRPGNPGARPQPLWTEREQAQRAWAIEQAASALLGGYSDEAGQHLVEIATAIIAYVNGPLPEADAQ